MQIYNEFFNYKTFFTIYIGTTSEDTIKTVKVTAKEAKDMAKMARLIVANQERLHQYFDTLNEDDKNIFYEIKSILNCIDLRRSNGFLYYISYPYKPDGSR